MFSTRIMTNRIFCLVIFVFFSSCAPTRNITYLNDLKGSTEYSEQIKNRTNARIQPDDVLSIVVSSLNPESNLLFNNGVLQTIGGTSGAPTSTSRVNDGYLVDQKGNINFPVLGRVELAGLTKEQATDKMTDEIKKSVKNPIVNIRFLNFKVTVIGEVNKPSTFTVANERLNVIEALGMAGDMTAYGKRENILIIREQNGVRSISRVNLASKDILNSPSFYLQQNDIVYVEPIKTKALQSSAGLTYLSGASLIVSILSIVLLAFR
jgi:polysaccharide export outer membrane protein